MGNLCSTPSTRHDLFQQRYGVGQQYVGPNNAPGYGYPGAMMQAGPVPGYGQAAPAMQRVPEGPVGPGLPQARPGASTPTTTSTTTTTTTKDNGGNNINAIENGGGAGATSAQVAMGGGEEVDGVGNADHYDDAYAQQQLVFNWTKGKLIGAGAFGRVFQGLDNESGQIMAVKQVALTKDETLKGRVAEHVKALEAEVLLLRQLNHCNIVRYLGTERTDDTLNIFLEYVPGGSIASLIEKFGPLQESVIRKYTQQILRGLEYLHQRKIMHRDIKGANILVDGQ